MTLSPFIKWAGGKRGVMNELICRIPTFFNDYYEPFLGGGALLLELENRGLLRDKKITVSDLSEPLMVTYSVIKDYLDELFVEITKPEYVWDSDVAVTVDRFAKNKKHFNLLKIKVHRKAVNDLCASSGRDVDEIYECLVSGGNKNRGELFTLFSGQETEKLSHVLTIAEKVTLAALFIFLNKVGFNGMYRENAHGLYNIPVGTQKSKPTIFDKDLLIALSNRWRQEDISFYSESYEIVLANCKAGDFIYLDPPYDGPATSFTGYTKTNFSGIHQTELKAVMDLLTERGCKVMLSNAATEKILSMYRDSYTVEQISTKRCINSNGEKRKEPVYEVIIRNY